MYERLLERFCAESGMDAMALRAMIHGGQPATPMVVDTMAALLGVPRGAWRALNGARRRRVAEDAVTRHDAGVTVNKRRRQRKRTTPVHAALDKLGWNIKILALEISRELGRSVSRPAVHHWAVGQRKIQYNGKPHTFRTAAPMEVRRAAERVTHEEALRQGLHNAVLLPGMWPNADLAEK